MPPEWVVVELSEDDMTLAYTLARGRNVKERIFGPSTYGKCQSALDAHLMGVMGEMAVSKYFDVALDRNVYADHGQPGGDLIFPGGWSCQVKTSSHWQDPWLRVDSAEDHSATDFFVLCSCLDREVFLVGWLPKNKILALPKKRLVKGGPLNYLAGPGDLYAIRTLHT